jgi:hypothetical protein
LTNVSPALSVTALAVAEPQLHVPTATTSRLPATVFDAVVTARVVPTPCPVACWTNVGVVAAYPGAAAARPAAVSVAHRAPIAAVRDNVGISAPGRS